MDSKEYMPFVSIALATYNGERFLRAQLDSLLSQKYRHLEIVISDDASTDATQSILAEYASRDERVRWSVNPRPAGFISNFERAIAQTKGEIIFLCDQDDIWYEDKVAFHVKEYENQKVQWVYNEVQLVSAERISLGYLTDTMPDYYTRRKFTYYTWGSCVLGCATSYRATAIRDIWPADRYAPGHDSWMQLVLFPAKASYIPRVLQEYRQHEHNVVGLKSSPKQEKEIIAENMRYIASLVMNDRLQKWKRAYLLLILVGKRLRAIARRG